MNQITLTNKLDYLRGRLGSIEKVARYLELSLRTVQRWYSKEGFPDFESLEKIENAIKTVKSEEV